MLLVKTKIGLSNLHGIGLFADQFIPKGTATWKEVSPFDQQISTDEIQKLSDPAKEMFFKYSYLCKHSKKYILCFDKARFMNHSETPNTTWLDDSLQDIAIRDIYLGEELTCNYRLFDLNDAKEIHLYK